jgi:NDP-sugar pyrophosphorylase family protein
MVPIGNRPLIAYAVEELARAGIKDILISLHRLGGSIEAYCGSGARWGVRLDYSLQREYLGTAGSVKRAAQSLTETFVVLPADAVIDLDLAAALAHHRAQGCQATLILHPGREGAGGHPVIVDGGGRVVGVAGQGIARTLPGQMPASAAPPSDLRLPASDLRIPASDLRLPASGLQLYNTGALIGEPGVLDLIPPRTACDLYRDLIPALLARGDAVSAFVMAGYWNPLDSFPAYQEAQEVILRSAAADTPANAEAAPGLRVQHARIEGRQIAPGIWVGRNAAIHPSVRLAPPVIIGEGCQIGREVELGPLAVIGPNVVIDDEATIAESTIWADTYVGRLVNIDHRVVHQAVMVDVSTAEVARVVDEFLLAATTPSAIGGGARRILDQLVALILLALTLPVTLVLGLLAWAMAGGAPLDRQARVKGPAPAGEIFSLLRLRTRRRDGGLTGFGRWLERWGGNRLPELWNIVRGEMALVGVKPFSPDEAARVTEEWQQKRWECPPGFTGLWYVQAGAQADLVEADLVEAADLDEIVIADVYYAATRNWREDLTLLWRTPGAWWAKIRERKER